MTTATLLILFAAASNTFDLPPGLLGSLCYVESSYDVEAINPDDGHGDSIGVCQIKVETARTLGFQGTADQLRDPFLNSYYAGMYLSHQLRRYHGNILKGVASYNSGTWRVDLEGHTKNQKYVNKVMKAWKENKKRETPSL